MNKEEKIKIVGDLTACLTGSKNIYFTDISGLNAEQTSNLRRMCFEKGVAVSVVKNTLLKKAMDACEKDFSEFESVLKGNTTLMISDISNAPAKVIQNFVKKHNLDNPAFKAGHIEDSVYLGSEQLDVLVALKSKEELISDLLYLLKSPITNLVAALGSANQNISGILKSLENNTDNNNSKQKSSTSSMDEVKDENSSKEEVSAVDSTDTDIQVENNATLDEKQDENNNTPQDNSEEKN